MGEVSRRTPRMRLNQPHKEAVRPNSSLPHSGWLRSERRERLETPDTVHKPAREVSRRTLRMRLNQSNKETAQPNSNLPTPAG
jgi:hypothetical protein